MEKTFKENDLRIIYGFYALAMNELDIPPAIPHYSCWFEVRNPFLAAYGLEKHLDNASKTIEKHINQNKKNQAK